MATKKKFTYEFSAEKGGELTIKFEGVATFNSGTYTTSDGNAREFLEYFETLADEYEGRIVSLTATQAD